MARLASTVDAAAAVVADASSASRTGAASRLVFATVSDQAGLEAIRTEWAALFAAAGRPHQVFQTVEWLALWAAIYGDRRTRLAIVTGRADGRLVLIWPLVVEAKPGLRILSGMGEPLSQYTDALVADDVSAADLDRAFDHVLALPFDVASFRRVRDDAALAPMLRRRLGPSPVQQAAPFVDLSGLTDAEAFARRFSGKIRSSRRRRRRRLEERGTVDMRVHGPSPEAAAVVAEALAFKRDWARRHHVAAPALKDPRFTRFFDTAMRAGPQAPDMRVLEMRCGDACVGVALSVAAKGQLFGHVLAPKPGLEAWGLGGVLAEATIVDALAAGYAAIDLLAPADDYKLEWTSDVVGVGDYALARSLRGALYMRLWLRFGRAAAKRVLALAGRLRNARRRAAA